MNAFGDARKLEADSRDILMPHLRKWYPSIALLEHDTFGAELQQYGDAIGQSSDGKMSKFFEFKCEEEDNHGNFFFETWSNRQRWTTGWFPKLKADVLIYHFLKNNVAYVMCAKSLLQWAYAGQSDCERLFQFPLRSQDKRAQRNDTWGRCVPISVIEKEVGFKYVIQIENAAVGVEDIAVPEAAVASTPPAGANDTLKIDKFYCRKCNHYSPFERCSLCFQPVSESA